MQFGCIVSMCQFSPGESIDTTSFGQHDRQTSLGRIHCVVRFRSADDFSSFQKRAEMEKTGKNTKKKNSTIIVKLFNIITFKNSSEKNLRVLLL